MLEWKSLLIPSSHATPTVCVVIKWSYYSIREPLKPTIMIVLCSARGCGNYEPKKHRQMCILNIH